MHLLSVTQKKFPLRRRLTALKTTATLTQQNLMKMAPSLASMVMGNLERMPPTPQPCLQLYSSATETDLQMCCCTFMDSNTLIPFCCIRPSAVKSDWIRGIPSFSSTALSRLACGGFCCGFECHLSYSVEKNLAEVKFSACCTVQQCCVGTGLT